MVAEVAVSALEEDTLDPVPDCALLAGANAPKHIMDNGKEMNRSSFM
jgi:hypothetical protein